MNTRQRVSWLAGFAVTLGLATMVPARAAVETNIKIPIVQEVFVPCAADGQGEVLVLTGPLHILVTYTLNGNNVSGKFHFQPQGVTGVGSVTGDVYRAVGVTQGHFKGSLQNGQYSDTFVNNFRMIGPGPGNNLQVHDTIHITLNANGQVTAQVVNSRFTCD